MARFIKTELEKIMKQLQKELRKELRQQGHYLTGNLEQSITYEVKTTTSGYTGVMYAADYSIAINLGVRPEKIPYGGRTGRGGKSLYIEGLISFFRRRGLPEKAAQGAAFATATIHKREGMPSRSSFRFSKNGRRTGFVTQVIGGKTEQLAAILRANLAAVISVEFGRGFKIEELKIAV